MDQVGQREPKDSEHTAARQPTPLTQPRQPEQENAGAPGAVRSDGPQPVASPAIAGTTANVSMAVNGNGNGVTVPAADAQLSNSGMARPASPASHPQTTADATSSTGPGDLADRRVGWNPPAAGTRESPQAPPQQPQAQQQPQQPQSQYLPQPQPYSPHPHPHSPHPPAPAPASASASASALPPPHPVSLPPPGAPHPQTLRHLHPHPHPHPSPPPPQHQLYEHERVIQLQQPAPQHPSHSQIPPGPQYQQQYPQLQPPPHHLQHHHQHQHQQPPPHAPVTPVTPLSSTLPPLHQPHAPPYHSHSQPQPQPAPRSQVPRLPPSLSNKPIIMDPPGTRKSGQAPQSRSPMGFPSPTQDYATINPKFVDDCTRLNFAIQQSMPESVRRIVRDHWEKCLLGSEFHQAFILNSSIHHAVPTITQRAVRDFGSKMVTESKHELISHFTAEALDEVADIIISKASDSFLDKCLEKRLLTIEAKPLINALAKAERLGYEPGDVIQDDRHERVIPHEAYPGASAAPNGLHARPSQPPPAVPQANRSPLQCMKCFRTFTHSAAFDYHARFNVCSHIPPTSNGFEHSCPHCGQGFVAVDPLQVHLDNKICGNFGLPVKAGRGPGRPPKATPSSQSSPAVVAPPASQRPTTHGHSATQQSTPSHPRVAQAAAATPGSTGSGIAADPYGHLTEQQMQEMNEELQAAEEKYQPRFAEANLIADEAQRKMRLEGLRNSFGTKQSMIRKKYGVRLRERRTKAEIQAEKERLGIKRAEKEKATIAAARADAAPRPAAPSGWTAANTPRANPSWEDHDAKRRRTDEAGGYQTPYRTLAHETPTRKTLSVSEMGGGLAGSAATAAMHDPTLPPPSQPSRVYEQSGARVEIHEPGHPTDARSRSESATPTGSDAGGANGHAPHRSGAAVQQPVVIDDDDGSSDDDDEDIPSTLPSHVRKSLASAGSVASLVRAP